MPDSAKEEILFLLAREREFKDPPGIMDVGDIVSIIPVAPSDTMEVLRELFMKSTVKKI